MPREKTIDDFIAEAEAEVEKKYGEVDEEVKIEKLIAAKKRAKRRFALYEYEKEEEEREESHRSGRQFGVGILAKSRFDEYLAARQAEKDDVKMDVVGAPAKFGARTTSGTIGAEDHIMEPFIREDSEWLMSAPAAGAGGPPREKVILDRETIDTVRTVFVIPFSHAGICNKGRRECPTLSRTASGKNPIDVKLISSTPGCITKCANNNSRIKLLNKLKLKFRGADHIDKHFIDELIIYMNVEQNIINARVGKETSKSGIVSYDCSPHIGAQNTYHQTVLDDGSIGSKIYQADKKDGSITEEIKRIGIHVGLPKEYDYKYKPLVIYMYKDGTGSSAAGGGGGSSVKVHHLTGTFDMITLHQILVKVGEQIPADDKPTQYIVVDDACSAGDWKGGRLLKIKQTYKTRSKSKKNKSKGKKKSKSRKKSKGKNKVGKTHS